MLRIRGLSSTLSLESITLINILCLQFRDKICTTPRCICNHLVCGRYHFCALKVVVYCTYVRRLSITTEIMWRSRAQRQVIPVVLRGMCTTRVVMVTTTYREL